MAGRVITTHDAPSAAYTTYRCGGPFRTLVQIERADDFVDLAKTLSPDDAVLVVGRGSNLLVADRGFDGVAIVLAGEYDALSLDCERALAHAGAATALPVLARRAAAAGIAGLEFFVGIPGGVGGAVRMNAGGHGAETKDVLIDARVVDLSKGHETTRAVSELGLGYRQSALGPRDVVIAATFRGHLDAVDACTARIDEIVRWRRDHQPGGQNAGSVFTNPPNDAAGRLIDACGLKGLRVGGAVVSEKHANFIVAEPGARADDVFHLIGEVQRRVEDATGVHLEPELRLIGFEQGVGR